MRLAGCLSLFTLWAAAAQTSDTSFLRKATFEDRAAVVMSNDRVELTILPEGGAMANLVLADDPERLSPLWNPLRMAREAGQKGRSGGSLGHFVCVDGFGGVSPEERAAGMPGHGEAHVQPWATRYANKDGQTATLTFSAKLPLVQEVLTRTLRMVDGENIIYVQSELESLLSFDRPVCWAEHATIGSPFLEPGVTVVDMSARKSKVRPREGGSGSPNQRLASGKEFTWPMAPLARGGRVDLRAGPASLGVGDHTTSLMDPEAKHAWVTALHPGKRLLLGYAWNREEFPWLQNWEDYRAPGRLARGLEFSTQPFDVPRREAVQMASLFDAPTYRWLPAKSKIGARFLMFYARVPEGMLKVDSVRLESGNLIIEDRKAKKVVRLPASLPI